MNDKTQWSYLAGLFDGEGTCCIRTSKSKIGTETLYLQTKIANTKVELMKWLIKNFGGVYYASQHEGRNSVECYQWMPKGKKNREIFFLGILPYLVIKRKQVMLALEFDRMYEGGQKLTKDNPLYLENLGKREEMRKQMQALNHRGSAETTRETPQIEDDDIVRTA